MSNVQEIKALPGYDRKNPTGRDLAILVLMQPLHFNPCKVQPMKLPPAKFNPERKSTCSVYGWGTVKNPKKELRSELSVAQVKIWMVNDCWFYFPTKLKNDNYNSTICSERNGHKLLIVITFANHFLRSKTTTLAGRLWRSFTMHSWFRW